MMKYVLAILTYFLTSGKSLFKQSGSAFTQQMVLHVRAIAVLVVSCMISLVLFCVGTSLLVANVANQYNDREEFVFSVSSGIYFSLAVISFLVLIYCLRKQTWLQRTGFSREKQEDRKSSPLESALALLVMDFVEDRKQRRQEGGSGEQPSA